MTDDLAKGGGGLKSARFVPVAIRCVFVPSSVVPAMLALGSLPAAAVRLQQGAVLVCGPGRHGAIWDQADRDAA